MADLLDKFRNIKKVHQHVVGLAGRDPLGAPFERMLSPTQAVIDGKECVLLGSNNYLGLTFFDEAIEKAKAALDVAGTGTTGSRMANGSYIGHKALEGKIADFYNMKHCLLFTTGYQANVGFISAIAGRDDYIIIDADSHASIYDGCKLGDATVVRFRHNNVEDLERRLKKLPEGSNKLVVIEGIYSMLGDRAPLAEMVRVSKENGAYVMVDEAHSLGVLGENGRGLLEEAGVEDQIDFVLGTFSKSVGTIGGFCVSNHSEVENARFLARAYMFTASTPPSIVASAGATIDHIKANGKELMKKLWDNTAVVYPALKDLGFKVGPEMTPVIGVQMPSLEEGIRVWNTLYENGVYVNMALPPAIPMGKCLLRCSVSAAHTPEQLETVVKAFTAAKHKDEAAA